MAEIDLNELAEAVARREGKKVSVSIAQIKEVIRLTLEELAAFPGSSVLRVVERHAVSLTSGGWYARPTPGPPAGEPEGGTDLAAPGA